MLLNLMISPLELIILVVGWINIICDGRTVHPWMRERMEETEVPRFRDGQKEGWGMKLWQFDACGDDLG